VRSTSGANVTPKFGEKKVKTMFAGFFTARAEKKNAYLVYRALVSQARSSRFYADMGVPDTIEGRFDMILLHLFLVDQRLEVEGPVFVRLRRYIQETMISDMDRAFRELGVGDMSVGKEMKKVGAAWLGRRAAYSMVLAEDAPSTILAETVKKNIYRDAEHAGIDALLAYINKAKAALAGEQLALPKDCKLEFPAA
jgi:cytochrome b pre-mRNA-processing protein 3